MDTNLIPFTHLVEFEVRNYDGEELGRIEDVVLDAESGRIVYAVVSMSGLLGLGDRLFAVPWEALDWQPDDEVFNLNIERDKLLNVPAYSPEDIPAMTDSVWLDDLYEFYGIEPYWR